MNNDEIENQNITLKDKSQMGIKEESSHPDLESVTVSNDLNHSDDVSTMASTQSQVLDHHSKDYNDSDSLTTEEAIRINRIGTLISRRDWKRISTTAESFDFDDSGGSNTSSGGGGVAGTRGQVVSDDKGTTNLKQPYIEERGSSDISDRELVLVDKLESAVHVGDWAAVATISHDLKEEAMTMSIEGEERNKK